MDKVLLHEIRESRKYARFIVAFFLFFKERMWGNLSTLGVFQRPSSFAIEKKANNHLALLQKQEVLLRWWFKLKGKM